MNATKTKRTYWSSDALRATSRFLLAPCSQVPDGEGHMVHIEWYAARFDEEMPGRNLPGPRGTSTLTQGARTLREGSFGAGEIFTWAQQAITRELMTRCEVEVLDYWIATHLGWRVFGATQYSTPIEILDDDDVRPRGLLVLPTSFLPGRHIPLTELTPDWSLPFTPVALIGGVVEEEATRRSHFHAACQATAPPKTLADFSHARTIEQLTKAYDDARLESREVAR